MIFDVFRYATGVTTAAPHEPRLVTTALAHPNCLGVVEQVDAPNTWVAMDIARERFAAFDYTLTQRGRALCEELLKRRPAASEKAGAP